MLRRLASIARSGVATSSRSLQHRTLSQPLARDGALCCLEGAQRGQTRGRGLQRSIREVAGHRRDGNGEVVCIGGLAGRVAGDHVFRRRAALHGHAWRKEDHVDPRRADAGLRPVHKPDTLGRY